ncbi:HNH endonuclease [Staphylococcus pseudintermedius]|nr:HNH endonuclease [Staphylococcus pseudintermedius]
MEIKAESIIHKGNKLKLNELWLTCKNNPRYMVSNLGRVKGWHGGHNRWIFKKPRKGKDGYLTVGITNTDGTLTTARVHRLVAEAFVPNPLNLPVVNHKNSIKDNNEATNLEWATISYNTLHAYHSGNAISPASKFIKVSYPNGKLFSYYHSCAKMAKSFKTGRTRIEKDLLKGDFLNILKLEEVEAIPNGEIVGRVALKNKIHLQYLNPFKVKYENDETRYYENIKDFAIKNSITRSQAHRILIEKLPHLIKRFKIHTIERINSGDYLSLHIINY